MYSSPLVIALFHKGKKFKDNVAVYYEEDKMRWSYCLSKENYGTFWVLPRPHRGDLTPNVSEEEVEETDSENEASEVGC